MRVQRENSIYIKHIRDAAKKINLYVEKNNFDQLLESEWDQDAVIRNLEIIGEAANNLDPQFKAQYPQIPWRTIINFRNVLAHDYADIDLNIVWGIMTENVPTLLNQMQDILSQS